MKKSGNPNSKLMNRIRLGRIWLQENHEHNYYEKHLKLYEDLVDEADVLGIRERDCWEHKPTTVGELSDKEIIKELS